MGSVFQIIGPIMVGPSSSHTAGAVRLGLASRAIAGGQPRSARILLHGSFAQTYRGHGTDVALVAGLLGMTPDDERIPDSMKWAAEAGLEVHIEPADLGDVHPNTAKMELTTASGSIVEVTGSSVGGGAIVITRIGKFDVAFTGENHALIVAYTDQPGVIARITSLLATEDVNIATMNVSREARHGTALAIIQLDQAASPELTAVLSRMNGIRSTISLPPLAVS
jgi:L-serine dehydratase